MPVVPAGDAGAVGVGLLMAACTIQPGHAFAFRAAHDVGKVTTPVVALLRVICGGVTVDAARVGQDRIDLLPRG